MSEATPSTMRALRVHALTSDFDGCSLDRIPVPQVGPGEVLVRIAATAIGLPDILQCQGIYQDRPPLPFVPGTDVAGTVESVGDGVTRVRPGDRVAATRMSGGWAEYAVYSASELWHIPAKLSFAEAAAVGAAYLTAYVALVLRAKICPGEWLLVHGAAGGVGLAAVDLGKALGARVIAASTSDAKLAIVARHYSPDAVLNSSNGFREKVKEITDHGADVIFDPVGGDVFDESTRCIAFEGRLLVIGFAGGRIAEIKTNIPLIKSFSVVGVRAGETARRFPEKYQEFMEIIPKMAETGRIRPHVCSVLPLEKWRESFSSIIRKEVVGRAVMLIEG